MAIAEVVEFIMSSISFANIYEDNSQNENIDFFEILSTHLSSSEYRLYELKFIEQHSNREIADTLGININTIDKRFVQLKKKIKTILERL